MKPRRDRDERGAASLAQVVITAPALLFLLMLIVQFGLMFHARNVAEQAAQEGAATARRFDGTETAAQQRTLDYLTALGIQPLPGIRIWIVNSRGSRDLSLIA